MASGKDYYHALGVKRDASSDDIRKAYRRLARKHHPDLNPGDKTSEDRFKKVQEAYDILSDPKKRKMFDQLGFYSESGFPAGAAAENAYDGGFNFGGFDFSQGSPGPGAAGSAGGFGNFSDLFGNLFGKRGGGAPQPEKGSDLEYALNIDFWQSIKGTQVKLNVNRLEVCAQCHGTGGSGSTSAVCPQCQGSGQVTRMAGAMKFSMACDRCEGTGHLQNHCGACGGDGRRPGSDSVEVRIPPGVQAGSRLRVPGKGNAGSHGAPPGDLYITIRVEPHPFFEREGDDILIKIPVSVTEAGLGSKIEVPTVDGRALLKIPQGTQNSQKFRLREKGVYNSRKNARGDQIVEISIQAPDVRDERTRDLLKELAKIDSKDPRAELWAKV
jgi:molecular chaperone DnaJ